MRREAEVTGYCKDDAAGTTNKGRWGERSRGVLSGEGLNSEMDRIFVSPSPATLGADMVADLLPYPCYL